MAWVGLTANGFTSLLPFSYKNSLSAKLSSIKHQSRFPEGPEHDGNLGQPTLLLYILMQDEERTGNKQPKHFPRKIKSTQKKIELAVIPDMGGIAVW